MVVVMWVAVGALLTKRRLRRMNQATRSFAIVTSTHEEANEVVA